MILTCPNCGTQYVVKDGAIPPQGRQVRCASCKHSWHQDPEEGGDAAATSETSGSADDYQAAPIAERTRAAAPPAEEQVAESPEATDEATEPTDEADADHDESLAEAALIEPRSGPEAEQRAYEEAVLASEPPAAASGDVPQEADPGLSSSDQPAFTESARPTAEYDLSPNADEADPRYGVGAAASADDEFSPFADREIVERRGRSPVLVVAILVLVIAAIAAAFWFLAPTEWKAGVGLGEAGKTPLELMITHPDRQKLASGQESLTVTGRVINPTDATHAIPPIYAQLKSRSGQTIYSWTIAPPAPSLGPRASTSFNSTEVDVPPGGDDLTITLGAPKP